MPRISDESLNAVVFLYASDDDADAGTKFGGTGFLVGVPMTKEGWDGWGHFYAVSNRHVAQGTPTGFPVIRLNRMIKGVGTLPMTVNDWVPHHEADLAVCPIPGFISDQFRVQAFSTEMFITQQHLDKRDVGIGDDCWMLGRYVDMDGGTESNSPAVRFGNLAKAQPEIVKDLATGIRQESFLVEVRSLSGFSGSPVLVNQGAKTYPISDGTEHFQVGPTNQDLLLGIDWGHHPWVAGVYRGARSRNEREPTDLWTEHNSGMMNVVPAWKIQELLDDDELRHMRDSEEEDLPDEPPVAHEAIPA